VRQYTPGRPSALVGALEMLAEPEQTGLAPRFAAAENGKHKRDPCGTLKGDPL